MNMCLDGRLSGKSNKAKCSYFLFYIGQEDAWDMYNIWILSKVELDIDYSKPKINLTIL